MGGAEAITDTTIPRPAITGIATTRATADIGTTAIGDTADIGTGIIIGMTADMAITVEAGRTDEGTGGDRKEDRAPHPLLLPGPPVSPLKGRQDEP